MLRWEAQLRKARCPRCGSPPVAAFREPRQPCRRIDAGEGNGPRMLTGWVIAGNTCDSVTLPPGAPRLLRSTWLLQGPECCGLTPIRAGTRPSRCATRAFRATLPCKPLAHPYAYTPAPPAAVAWCARDVLQAGHGAERLMRSGVARRAPTRVRAPLPPPLPRFAAVWFRAWGPRARPVSCRARTPETPGGYRISGRAPHHTSLVRVGGRRGG